MLITSQVIGSPEAETGPDGMSVAWRRVWKAIQQLRAHKCDRAPSPAPAVGSSVAQAPSSASLRNTQLSITCNNSTYQSPRLSPGTPGLMPVLSGPRQGHSSWGGVTAGAWGWGTRQTPLGVNGASVTQPLMGVLVGGGREDGGALWMCYPLPVTSPLIHMKKYERGADFTRCTICKNRQNPALVLIVAFSW